MKMAIIAAAATWPVDRPYRPKSAVLSASAQAGPTSRFRAKTNLSALLDEVQKTGEPILVTRFGKPVA
ncbi:MAG: type II toxin-antitoxin system prevent-host-death family antitoxin, partial [Gammaproteobacteria bacterium]|nr:type II toxin-antitoxin system prevent-host-death family antitoxin [Gammaproteobacteria bacterium]